MRRLSFRPVPAALRCVAAALGLAVLAPVQAGDFSDEFDRQRFKSAFQHEIAFREAALHVAWSAEPLCDDTSEIEPFVLWSLRGVRKGLSNNAQKLFTQATGMDEHWRIAWLDESAPDTLRLGQRTSTGDREGAVVEERPVVVDAAALQAAVARFTGPISQLPPMHSALKKDGRALYEYARAGEVVERAPRVVRIHAIDIVGWQDAEVVIDVRCSKGTYIRTLAEDIGEALGCGAHLSALRRTASGPLTLAGAVTLADLEAMTEPDRETLLQPVDTLLADWPMTALDAAEADVSDSDSEAETPPPPLHDSRDTDPNGAGAV